MWTTFRSVILAAVLAPAVLFLPPLPVNAGGADRASQPAAVAVSTQAPSCQRAAWPYNANCADQSSQQLRLVSTDRVIPAGSR